MAKYYVRFSCNFDRLKQQWNYMKLCCRSLTYNSIDTFAETAFEPLICVVQFLVRWFGVIFVALVIGLVTAVVVIFYICIIPVVMENYYTLHSYIHLIYGHYLLIMICFHYYKGVTTRSGAPSKELLGVPVTCMCKRCFCPKPPRTHHCNVCKSCQLKMDHHCPWLNNCVGHFNHRYFISFCIFMCLGTIYVSFSSWSLFKDCFHAVEKYDAIKVSLRRTFGSNDLSDLVAYPRMSALHSCSGKGRAFSNSVVFLWILCSSVTMALGCLTLWHIFLISRGETSIERLINQKERLRLKKLNVKFTNPYNHGVLENWKRLLVVRNFSHRIKSTRNGSYRIEIFQSEAGITVASFVFRVLLPSSHPPAGDGIVWKTERDKVFLA